MSFISNVLNSIPVVGHVKAGVHYALGDKAGGHNALYQSTRTTAVLAGGAVGCIGGPGGAALGGIYAGLLTDGLVSTVSDTGVGIFEPNLQGGLATVGLKVAMDGVGGFGMGGVSKLVSQIPEKVIETTLKETTMTVGKTAIKEAVVKTQIILVSSHVASKASGSKMGPRFSSSGGSSKGSGGGKSSSNSGNNNSGAPPPQKNNSGPPKPPQGNNQSGNKVMQDEYEEFLKLFKEILKNIYGNNPEPFTEMFKKLTPGERDYLIKVLKNMSPKSLKAVIELVIKMFKDHFPNDIRYENFLSLLEFVASYISRAVNDQARVGRPTTINNLSLKQLKQNILETVLSAKDILTKLVNLFKKIKNEILTETSGNNAIVPNFRDLFAAVYHYFKHCRVPGDGELTVKQYYDLIKKILKELKESTEYKQIDSNSVMSVVCEMYLLIHKRMFKIVINIRFGTIVLSTAYVDSIIIIGIKDGKITITIETKPKPCRK